MPGRIEETTPEDVLEVFRLRRDAGEPLTAPEIAEHLQCSRRTALNKLNHLVEDGRLESKEVGGRSKVFWQPIDGDEVKELRNPPDPNPVDPDRIDGAHETVDTSEPVGDRTPTPDAGSQDGVQDALEDVVSEFPSTVDPTEGIAAIEAARDYLEAEGPATMREIVAEVHPDHPLGYKVDRALEKVEAGERYRGAWWRRIVKPGLEAADDVEKPPRGASEWRYSRD